LKFTHSTTSVAASCEANKQLNIQKTHTAWLGARQLGYHTKYKLLFLLVRKSSKGTSTIYTTKGPATDQQEDQEAERSYILISCSEQELGHCSHLTRCHAISDVEPSAKYGSRAHAGKLLHPTPAGLASAAYWHPGRKNRDLQRVSNESGPTVQ
jgi:hypothetical protein